MLNALIASKTKRAILKQLLTNSEKKYYVRQMASILDMSVGTIHRELIKFEKNSILKSENIGNLRFFSANKSNPLFKELKQIIFKTEGINVQ
jgi:DNA-binding transcriptional ArsR family regulator